MDIKLQILSAEESWEHQLSVYQNYHQKYAQFYSPDKFFYHPYLQSKFSEPALSPNELKNIKFPFCPSPFNPQSLQNSGNPFLTDKSLLTCWLWRKGLWRLLLKMGKMWLLGILIIIYSLLW